MIATWSPASTNAWAMARPIPRFPPVTSTDLLNASPSSALGRSSPPDAIASRSADVQGLLVVLQAEAQLEPDLEVLDLVVDDMAADLGDLEPVEVTQRAAGPLDGVADGVVDALRSTSRRPR